MQNKEIEQGQDATMENLARVSSKTVVFNPIFFRK